MIRGRQRSDLDSDRMLQLALVRLVEVVGEAAARVTPVGQQRYGQIPWTAAKGMRNRLIHGYDKIDLNVLGDTIQVDFPPLIMQLRTALKL